MPTARVMEMLTLLLKNMLDEDPRADTRDDIIESLMEQGHNPSEIHTAMSIFENIRTRLESPQAVRNSPVSNRLFSIIEEFHINSDIRGYLTRLRNLKVLTPVQREEIVDRLLLLDPEQVNIEEVEILVDEALRSNKRGPTQYNENVSEFYH